MHHDHPAICASCLTRTFGSFTACDAVGITIAKGEIHAIVGENGAGKSTLANMLYGLLRPDSGSISVDGKAVAFSSPREAIRAGIGMVHQHFMLVPSLSVTENIILGAEHTPLLSPMKMGPLEKEIAGLSRKHSMEIDPQATVSTLSVGEQQRVEILKLLFRKADVLILDEPTAVLSPPETEKLFATLRSLAAAGHAILLVTHKLDEVLGISDTVSIMRKGRLVGKMPTREATKEAIARLMVGRDVLLRIGNPVQVPGKEVLTVEKLAYRDPSGQQRLGGISFSVRAGEVYGLAGVEGNGQSALLSLLWGVWDRHGTVSGRILLDGRPVLGQGPGTMASLGVSMVPEDRLRSAVLPALGLEENLILGRHREPGYLRKIGFDRAMIRKEMRRVAEVYDIRSGGSANPPVAALSGGNQQKLVIAREMERPGLRLLLLAQPTRGVDIGAIEMIHARIIEARQRGVAILLVSSELEEIIALSTRIGCIYNGTLRHEFTEDAVRAGRAESSGFEKEIGLHIT